ncbi:sugar ABC transporter ATP-binding protein [Rhizobium sp. KVB221]|uniref:Sugar ABC transporter ATP-binding protein n=1 Tax=Rhizobium setariae TaxID=2801340 RepID=A0A937CRA9_9HYPH|nr:sugar ABC transporter ATP-binding protein [Rhizobium setariae]MBL0375158.1 sugar ABC transporter ATP-binding protein [Rhizobium setariae]
MLLEIRALEKRFSGARALAGADLAVEAGSVHGLLGENGAGKSTLIKSLSGLVSPDAGEIRIDGKAEIITSVRHAEDLGFRFIHQELSLVPHFTAVENAFVGRPYPKRGLFVDRAAMRAKVAATARDIAPDLPLDIPVGRMTTGQKQLVEIIRALMNEPARLVVMDEPTASLSDGEARRLHQAVRALAARGVAVIFISHRLDEVLDICDRYTVLRNGATTGTGAIADVNRADLVRLMSGHEEIRGGRAAPVAGGKPVLEVRDLPFGRRGSKVSLSVREGEIVGLYGLVGAGRSSFMKVLWGSRTSEGGTVFIDGASMRSGDIGARIAAGGAYVPEDRRGEGLITARSIAENLAITNLKSVRSSSGLPLTSRSGLAARTADIKQQLSIKMGSPWAHPLTLSGGNQQKLLFGRWFGGKIRLLILDEPSRGVDVGAKEEIHAIVRRLASEGVAVLMTTSDMDELLALSNRVLVLANGEFTSELSGDELSPQRIVAAAFHHPEQKESLA